MFFVRSTMPYLQWTLLGLVGMIACHRAAPETTPLWRLFLINLSLSLSLSLSLDCMTTTDSEKSVCFCPSSTEATTSFRLNPGPLVAEQPPRTPCSTNAFATNHMTQALLTQTQCHISVLPLISSTQPVLCSCLRCYYARCALSSPLCVCRAELGEMRHWPGGAVSWGPLKPSKACGVPAPPPRGGGRGADPNNMRPPKSDFNNKPKHHTHTHTHRERERERERERTPHRGLERHFASEKSRPEPA